MTRSVEVTDKENAGIRIKPVTKVVTGDSLMRDFKGSNIILLAMIAIVLHVTLVVGSSFGYLSEQFLSGNASEMSKEERVKAAVSESTSAISKIAERHDLSMNDVLEQFMAAKAGASGTQGRPEQDAKPAPKAEPTQAPPESTEPKDANSEPSELEKSLPKATPGPAAPKTDDDDVTGL
jgi:hypothetical protein